MCGRCAAAAARWCQAAGHQSLTETVAAAACLQTVAAAVAAPHQPEPCSPSQLLCSILPFASSITPHTVYPTYISHNQARNMHYK